MKFINVVKRVYGCFAVYYHGFWFVDIPRTSSTSVRSELGKKFGRVYGKTNVLRDEYASPQIFLDHIPAQKMRTILGRFVWNRIFTFSMVRNPWDRIFSMYNYRKRVKNLPSDWSFRDYVLALEQATPEDPIFRYHGFRYGASDYLVDEQGNIIVDFIARYENREEDLKHIVSQTKLNTLGSLDIQKATPEVAHYSQAYDAQTREIIRNLYSRDIELFDYSFKDLP